MVAPSPPGWPITSVCKYRKTQLKCSHFDKLSDNAILRVFSCLSSKELSSVSRVCRRWYHLAWDPSLWKTITLNGEKTCADKAIKCILHRLCGQDQNGSCSNVRQLFVYDGAKITDKGLILLSRRCTELTHVQLQNCPTLTDSAISELVARCPCIQHLDVTGKLIKLIRSIEKKHYF